MEDFVLQLKEFSDTQLQSLIHPIATVVGSENRASPDSSAVACSLLAQLILEHRRNRALIADGNAIFGAVTPFMDKLKFALDAFFPEPPAAAPVPTTVFQAPDAEHVG